MYTTVVFCCSKLGTVCCSNCECACVCVVAAGQVMWYWRRRNATLWRPYGNDVTSQIEVSAPPLLYTVTMELKW